MTSPERPVISVMIATHDRRELLRRCLLSLRRQDADPAEFEVIVALDGGTDGTASMVEELPTPFALRVLRREKAGKAVTLNAAIESARGKVCLYLDDDMIADPGLVAGHLAAHRSNPLTVGLGAIYQRPIDARDWYAETFARAWNKAYAERELRAARWNDCYGANLSAPRAKLLEVGGIKPIPTAEDIELGYRLERAGCALTFLPEASGTHDDQKPGKRMLADQRAQGRAHVELADAYPELTATLLPWRRNALRGMLPLRRLLLAVGFPPRALAALGRLVPEKRAINWWELVESVAFWKGVRGAVDKDRWRVLTGRVPGGPDRGEPEPR